MTAMEASDHPLVREKLHYKALNGDHWHALCHLPRPLQGADAILGPLQSRCEAHRLGHHRRLSLLQANEYRMVHFTKNSALFQVGTLQTFFCWLMFSTTIFFFIESIHVYNLKPMLSLDMYLLSTLCFPVCSFIPCLYDLWNVEHTNASCPPVPHAGVTLIAKFCVNTAFSGCRTHFSHIAASPYAKWQHRLNKLCLTGGCHVTQH